MGLRKIFVGGFLVVGLLVVGFIFLVRSCLSKHDERSAIVPALIIQKDGKSVLFSLVKFEKTNSYSQRGGFFSKSVSTTWYAQTNDPQSGAAIAKQKIKHHSDVNHWPVQTLGSANGLAWVFVGEIMAFDPFTLEKKADKNIIETQNPSLKGKLSDEGRYYHFNRADGTISFTANDGTLWKLNTSTLKAEPQEEEEPEDKMAAEIKRVEALRNNTRDYKERDSLQRLLHKLRNEVSAVHQQQRVLESFRRSSISFHAIKTNQDTVNGQWLGLYSQAEFEKLHNRISISPEYDDKARRQLYTSVYFEDRYGNYVVSKEQATLPEPSQYFLQGGFLLDKQTAQPVQLENGYLVVHKDKIGNEGEILVSRIDTTGKIVWNMETGLTEWDDWIITRERLIILGADNPELSGNDCNVLWSVDLQSGQAVKYDYFTDK